MCCAMFQADAEYALRSCLPSIANRWCEIRTRIRERYPARSATIAYFAGANIGINDLCNTFSMGHYRAEPGERSAFHGLTTPKADPTVRATFVKSIGDSR